MPTLTFPNLQLRSTIVKDGEDLTEICIRFGFAGSVIRELNGPKIGEGLRPGMVIKLPKYD